MGIGDEFMALGDASRMHSIYPASPIVIGDGSMIYRSQLYHYVPWLWQGSMPVPLESKWVISFPGRRPYCDYDRMIREARERFGYKGEMDGWQAFRMLKRKYWRKDYSPMPAPIVLTPAEQEVGIDTLAGLNRPLAGVRRPIVLVEPHIKLGAAENKRWPFGRYQRVVDACKDRCTFVQWGKPLLRGVFRLPPMVIRNALGVVAHVDAYLGAEGGLHHASAAVGRPAVVIFGGYINPSVTGYAMHQNLFVECEDEGCPGPTPAGEEALAAITVEQVVAALDTVLLDIVGDYR